ncbi:UDP-sugar pyrophosphorylase 1 [Micractinium conductrix]|uniref:UTP-monosaccharide-1-phosphate uridylyltransferase n=1 Tax=Micractinium conductrix TaxID=554055 RepID=A0A2P6VA50_9CHLO|nr:UDP-sugar pyrophosphorylase 1 [Micractinium conductrix]|eukprot:PSC70970.1 UDP-sugar pyrophosphorylase 1 [Micractinium conductrix]
MAAAEAPPLVEGGLESNRHAAWMTPEDAALAEALLAEGQGHLFQRWPAPGTADADKQRMLAQLRHLDTSYAGGLRQYIQNARRLLHESKEGVNPFEGCVPSVPEGEKLDFGSERFRELERAGVKAAGGCAFVLVAGGLGERLGYSGIKVAFPVESASGRPFLQLYVEHLLALGAKAGRALPLAIMTSDDTHQRTLDLLERHAYFGAAPGQVTLIKQEKVACLADNDAHLALLESDPFQVQTKPHGHGDVHMLLHSTGLADKWLAEGFNWICFFQDTNGLVFRALPAAIGVSEAHDYDVNSLAVPRKAKEAIGAITKLTYPDGRNITINVEYNQLDPLLRATVSPEGEVNDGNGFSPYPGNINQLVLKLSTYCGELARHGGVIAEFVNPKYRDASRDAFKSSTRLECMMQDFAKNLPEGTRVGFTVVNQVWAAYSPVKNSPADAAAKWADGNPSHSATAAELDWYMCNCKMLQALGARVDGPAPAPEFNGLKGLELWPRVTWSPLWATCWDDVEAHVTAAGLHVGADATLVINAPDATIRSLDLQRGALVIDGGSASGSGDGAAAAGAPAAEAGSAATAAAAAAAPAVVVEGVTVDNAGWEWRPLPPDEACAEEEYIRGFRVVRNETMTLP